MDSKKFVVDGMDAEDSFTLEEERENNDDGDEEHLARLDSLEVGQEVVSNGHAYKRIE